MREILKHHNNLNHYTYKALFLLGLSYLAACSPIEAKSTKTPAVSATNTPKAELVGPALTPTKPDGFEAGSMIVDGKTFLEVPEDQPLLFRDFSVAIGNETDFSIFVNEDYLNQKLDDLKPEKFISMLFVNGLTETNDPSSQQVEGKMMDVENQFIVLNNVPYEWTPASDPEQLMFFNNLSATCSTVHEFEHIRQQQEELALPTDEKERKAYAVMDMCMEEMKHNPQFLFLILAKDGLRQSTPDSLKFDALPTY